MSLFDLLGTIERRFDSDAAWKWMSAHWYWSIVFSLTYACLVFAGRRIMKSKAPFQLRRALTMWNAGLAVFSIIGSARLAPEVIRAVLHGGFIESVCHTDVFTAPRLSIWAWCFTLSKAIELGDTAFIILRKSQLHFLHWYHHMTVLAFTWFANSFPTGVAIGAWFTSMNFSVHSIMYSYYAIKATGRKIPQWTAQLITMLQLCQMLVAIACNLVAYFAYHSGRECTFYDNVFYVGMVIYCSYAVLFLNFFFRRYVFCGSAKID